MIYLDKKSSKHLYEQLYDGIIAEIFDGTLPKNTALKPIRFLAKELNVSLNTVQRAYQQLMAEGYIHSVPGSGYYVEDISNTFLNHIDRSAQKNPSHDIAVPEPHPLPALTAAPPSNHLDIRYDFKHDAAAPCLFPWQIWRRCVNNALLEEENRQTIQYESNQGNLHLRKELCQILHRNRGVSCLPEQIVIVPGTQYAMEIICSLLPASKHRIAYEEPAHNGMRNIFLQNGYQLTPIPVTDHGIDMEKLTASDCNLAYIMPSHQFPTGVTFPVSNRIKLLEWAVRRDAFIIENDYDSAFTYRSRPIPALQSLDKYGHVIYFNTLAKILTPSMRTAFFILPLSLLDRYRQMYRYFNAALPSYHQEALAKFMASGAFERHLRKIIKANEKKCDLLIDSIRRFLSEKVEILGKPAGSHVIVRIHGCSNAQALIAALKKKGIAIYGLTEYWHTAPAPEDIFLLGFAAMRDEEIPTACQSLAKALAKI